MVSMDSKWYTLISYAPILKMAHPNQKTAQVLVCVHGVGLLTEMYAIYMERHASHRAIA